MRSCRAAAFCVRAWRLPDRGHCRMSDALPPTEGFPRRFGPYLLLNAFAHGGMGEVYLAKHGSIEGIDRLCVLKKLRPDFTRNEEYVRRFIDEARVVVQLNHANICHVFDVGRVEHEYYLAMEYVSGVNLRVLHQRAAASGSRVPEAVALWLIAEMLEALDYAHRHTHPMTGQPLHLVHRDVSPQNVMVNYEGEIKLIDFGLAASDLKEEQTESQVVMGKVAYMSPEQARGDKVTPQTDQFAAAIVAYEVLMGERYYGEMNNYQIWQVVGRGGFTPPAWDRIPEALRPILARALHGDLHRRYESCGDFKDAITRYLVQCYPTTSKRTVRTLLRELFQEDTQKERSFLARFADVSAAQFQPATAQGGRSVSLLLPSQSVPENPAPPAGPGAGDVALEGTEMLIRPGKPDPGTPAMTSIRDDTQTSVLAKRAFGGPRPEIKLFVGVGLVVMSAFLGYFGVRSLRATGSMPAPAADGTPAASTPATTLAAPDADPRRPATTEPASSEEPRATTTSSSETAPPPAELPPARRAAVAVAKAPAPKTHRAPRAGDEADQPRPQRAMVSPKTATDTPQTAAALPPLPPKGPAEDTVDITLAPATEVGLQRWRKRVLAHLQGCRAGCAKLIRPKLPDVPLAEINEHTMRSIGSCVEQCRADHRGER